MALAHELLGGPSCAYYLALARTYLLKEDFSKCEECLCEAVRIDFMVILCVRKCRMLPQRGRLAKRCSRRCLRCVFEPRARAPFPLEQF